MSSDPDALTLLLEAPADEVNVYQGLLQSNGIHCAVLGEQHAAFSASLIGASAIVVPRLMVREADLEKARALLAASPILDSTLSEDGVPEGSVCPVHEQPAVAVCARCGTFLCAGCGSLGSPALCEDCLKVPEERKPRTVGRAIRMGVALMYLVPLGGMLLFAAAAVVWKLFH